MATIDSVKLPDNSTYDLTDNYSGYAKKVAGATTDDLAKLTATGDLADSGKKLSDLVLKADVKDVLNSTSTTDPLSANQGRVLADNLAANENVYGAKNILSYPYEETTKTENGVTFTDNGDGTISVVASSGATADTYFGLHYPYKPLYVEKGTYILSGCPTGGSESTYFLSSSLANDTGAGATFIESSGDNRLFLIVIKSGTVISTPITFKPMIRDARIVDDTFAPYAETNLQLTQNKAERNDLSTIHATGSTNTTGAQIDKDALFYLNGTFCKALANIAANATFTLNTNYKVDTVGEALTEVNDDVSFTVSSSLCTIVSQQGYRIGKYCVIALELTSNTNTTDALIGWVTPFPRQNGSTVSYSGAFYDETTKDAKVAIVTNLYGYFNIVGQWTEGHTFKGSISYICQ